MEVVKIKNLNKSYMNKAFIVKGRVKYTKLEKNKNFNIEQLNSVIFDDSSEIQVIAFEYCQAISSLLKTGDVVQIKYGKLIDNKNNKKTKHKYIIELESHSIITTINKDEVNNDDFPIHKYISGAALKTLIPGMIIDVKGVLVQLNSKIEINTQSQTFRKGIIKVDSIEIEVRFLGEKAKKLYNVGNKLFLSKVKYITLRGCKYLSVESSTKVRCTQNQQSRNFQAGLEDFTSDSPNQKQSTSGSSPCNKNFTSGSPNQKQSTSGSSPCKKNSLGASIKIDLYSSPSSSNNNFTSGSPNQKQSTSGSSSCIKNFTSGSPNQKQSTSGSSPCKKNSLSELFNHSQWILDSSPWFQNFTSGSPNQKQSTSGSSPCKKNFTSGSPNQKQSTSGSSPCKKNFTSGSPNQKQSTSGSSPCKKNFTSGSPNQKQSTSGSSPCKKRKTQDLNVEEVTSKIQKIEDPEDDKFTKVVLKLLKNIKSNNEAVKLRIIEFISDIISENDT